MKVSLKSRIGALNYLVTFVKREEEEGEADGEEKNYTLCLDPDNCQLSSQYVFWAFFFVSFISSPSYKLKKTKNKKK